LPERGSPVQTTNAMDASIFGLRFKSNAELQPDPADLAAFLRSPRTPGAKEARQDDLATFVHYVDLVEQSETDPYSDQGRKDFGEFILLSVLSQTRFFRRTLRIAIEEYLYHHHQLLALDFSKPEKFVRSAEEEVNRLNSKKKDDQQKIARLQVLIEQRNKDLETLTKQRRLLTGELCHIAAYVHDNIMKIQQLCESAIARLSKLHVGGKKTEQLIEDLKAQFKDKVRECRQMETVTPEYLESMKVEVAQISQRLTQLVLGDIYTVTGVYEGFYEHEKKNAPLWEKRREMLDHVSALLKEQYRGEA
jgi:hypothetical protein